MSEDRTFAAIIISSDNGYVLLCHMPPDTSPALWPSLQLAVLNFLRAPDGYIDAFKPSIVEIEDAESFVDTYVESDVEGVLDYGTVLHLDPDNMQADFGVKMKANAKEIYMKGFRLKL